MAAYAKLIYNNKVQTVALFDGLSTDELISLLKTVFNIEGNIVGIIAEKGLVIPISLVSRSPSVIPNTLCKILVANDAANNNTASNKSNNVTGGINMTSQLLPPSPPDLTQEDSNSEEESSVLVTREIVEFLDALQVRNFLTTTQTFHLKKLLASNSTLLFAAYSVAISANDSEYFAEICKDLAQSLQSEQGRIACEAQDEVLQVSDQLYINNRISENQLLYLRHLVLIREEAVATIYDEFQEHQNVPALAKALYDLCNTHPYQHAKIYPTNNNGNDQEDNDDEEDDEEDSSNLAQNPMTTTTQNLNGVVSLMMRTKSITSTEAQVLLEMIKTHNEYVLAAYELFESDRNLEELQDTLLRCVKLEVRKRMIDVQEDELNKQYKRTLAGKYDEEENADEEEDEEEEEEEDDDDEEEDETKFNIEDISLESILESLGVVNIWEKSVPDKFVKTMFIAVFRKQLDIYQAKALCDLYHAEYDLVRAAWEVFTVQEDVEDLIDTLRRVVRDLTLDEDGDNFDEEEDDDNSDEEEEENVAPSGNTGTASTSAFSSTTEAVSSINERKQEALAAVAAAKRELLKHSLEMMVKQGITTGDSASKLYARYLNGDILCEAAIDGYAADRNVVEFLDTLQILANHSTEELSEMMKDVASTDEQQEEATHKSTTAATTTSNNSSIDANKATSNNSNNQLSPVQMQLKAIISELTRNGMISDEVTVILTKLVSDLDHRLLLAYKQYSETQQGAQLIDTLLQIAAQEIQSNADINYNEDTNEEYNDEKEGEDEGDEPTETLLNASDQKTVIEILSRANAITPTQTNQLNSLVDAKNAIISKVFLTYEKDKDVYKLIDSLKQLDLMSLNSNEDDKVDDDDNNDEEDSQSIESKFLQIVQEMQLTQLETAALRLAIARNDVSIRESIEAFRVDMNEEKLKLTMKDIALEVINNTLAEDNDGENDDENDGDNDDDDDEDDELNEMIEKHKRDSTTNVTRSSPLSSSSSSSNPYTQQPHYTNYNREMQSKASYDYKMNNNYDDEEEEDEDNDEEEDEDNNDENDEDDEEDPGQSLLTSQAARNHVFPILVSELLKENIINKSQGSMILKQFSQGNAAISAAIDVYDRDSDLAQLVFTLQQSVEVRT